MIITTPRQHDVIIHRDRETRLCLLMPLGLKTPRPSSIGPSPIMRMRVKPVWARALFLAGVVTRISIYTTAALSQSTA
ncbi:hypothetical protein LY76DRAFT_24844 [Colletotrichum caudatum]|nr:hypothetical protein LY76DRAFT_24844 [Colletotrichum caudatum]